MRHASLLDAVLEPDGVSVVFQPIFDLSDGEPWVESLECLARGPRGTNVESAEMLFEYARRKRCEAVVDRACATAALAAAARLPYGFAVSVNLHASTLSNDPRLVPFLLAALEKEGMEPSRVTVEIVEYLPAWDGAGLVRAIAALREAGLRIALDDIGLGHSNYRMILDSRPDLFKVDRYLVQGCHADADRQAVLDSIALLADRFGSQVVAEGVELEPDLEVLRALGILHVQGHLLCPPLPAEEVAALAPPPSGNGRPGAVNAMRVEP